MTTATLSFKDNFFNSQDFNYAWLSSSEDDSDMNSNNNYTTRRDSVEPDMKAWELEFDQFNSMHSTPYDFNVQIPYGTSLVNFNSNPSSNSMGGLTSGVSPSPHPHTQQPFLNTQQLQQIAMAEIQRNRFNIPNNSHAPYNPAVWNSATSVGSSVKEETSLANFQSPPSLAPNTFKHNNINFKPDTFSPSKPVNPLPSNLHSVWTNMPPIVKSSLSSLPVTNTNRLCWTKELHQMFEESIEALGRSATAKNVMLMMIAKGADQKSLTRIRVANHLQYYNSRNKKKQANSGRAASETQQTEDHSPSHSPSS